MPEIQRLYMDGKTGLLQTQLCTKADLEAPGNSYMLSTSIRHNADKVLENDEIHHTVTLPSGHPPMQAFKMYHDTDWKRPTTHKYGLNGEFKEIATFDPKNLSPKEQSAYVNGDYQEGGKQKIFVDNWRR